MTKILLNLAVVLMVGGAMLAGCGGDDDGKKTEEIIDLLVGTGGMRIYMHEDQDLLYGSYSFLGGSTPGMPSNLVTYAYFDADGNDHSYLYEFELIDRNTKIRLRDMTQVGAKYITYSFSLSEDGCVMTVDGIRYVRMNAVCLLENKES